MSGARQKSAVSVKNQSATTSQSSLAIELRACLAFGVECAGFMPQQK